jgi:hypothetical protein
MGSLMIGHRDEPEPSGAAGVAVRNDPSHVHHAIGLKELAEGVIGDSKREIAYIDIHVQFLGERRDTITTSSTQYAATIPRRSSGETRHEDQRRGPMILSDSATVSEKSAQRYVFRDGRNDGGALVHCTPARVPG